MKFNGRSDDDLVADNQKLGAKADEIRAQRAAINAELADRAAKAHADRLLSGLSDRDVSILVEAATARGAGIPPQ